MQFAKLSCLILIPLALLASCASAPAGQELVGSNWTLISLDGTTQVGEALGGQAVTLIFTSTTEAGGSGGCNSFGAQYSVSGNRISFSEIFSTLMACTGAGIDEVEATYFASLGSAEQFEIVLCEACPIAERLTITGGDHTLIFERTSEGS